MKKIIQIDCEFHDGDTDKPRFTVKDLRTDAGVTVATCELRDKRSALAEVGCLIDYLVSDMRHAERLREGG